MRIGLSELEAKSREKIVADSLQYIKNHPSYHHTFDGTDNTYAWWASIADLTLSNCLIDLSIPIYLAQGSEDLMSPPISAERLKSNFEEKMKHNLHYVSYEGYDHSFQDKEGNSHLVEVVMNAIEWILNQ